MTINIEHIAKAHNRKESTQYNNDSVVRALRTVTSYLIADVFELTPEEIMWSAYHMDLAFKPLSNEKYSAIPAPVHRELQAGTYGKLLEERETLQAKPIVASDEVKKASIDDWTDVFMETVLTSYPELRPLNEAKIRGYISGLLKELGVSDPKNPRGSKYLPNTVMNFLARRGE